jgi:hypothetical protein
LLIGNRIITSIIIGVVFVIVIVVVVSFPDCRGPTKRDYFQFREAMRKIKTNTMDQNIANCGKEESE